MSPFYAIHSPQCCVDELGKGVFLHLTEEQLDEVFEKEHNALFIWGCNENVVIRHSRELRQVWRERLFGNMLERLHRYGDVKSILSECHLLRRDAISEMIVWMALPLFSRDR